MRITLGTLKRIIREAVNEQMMGPEHFDIKPGDPGTPEDRAKLKATSAASYTGSWDDPMGLAKKQAADITAALGASRPGPERIPAARAAHALATKMGPEFAMSHFGRFSMPIDDLAELARTGFLVSDLPRDRRR